MAPRPEDRPSAEKVLQSQLLAGRRTPSPAAQQTLAHQLSTASTQSTATLDAAAGAAAAAGVAAGAGGTKQYGGLVLQRSIART